MAPQKLTEYERQRQDNIRRREEMMAALNIHAKAQQLSASSKRHRVQANSYGKKKPKTETPVVARRSLRLRGKPAEDSSDSGRSALLRAVEPHCSDAKGLCGLQEKSVSSSHKRPSARSLGPLRMDDAYRGSDTGRALIELIMQFSGRIDLSVKTEKEFEDEGSEKPKLGSPIKENESFSFAVNSEGDERNGGGHSNWIKGNDTSNFAVKSEGDERNGGGLSNLIKGNESFSCGVKSEGDEQNRNAHRNLVMGNESLGCAVKSEGDKLAGSIDLEHLTLEQENIARIVPGRILALRFFPTADTKMIMAGNKFGDIGFWDLNSKNKGGNGIYLYHPHSAPVSGISVHPRSLSKIYTSCYDGFIRMMHAEKEVFDLVYSSDEAIFSLSQRPNDDTSCIYFSEGYGGLNSLDIRAVKSSSLWMLHEDRINSIDFKVDNPNIMATSSTDGTVRIWDLRRIDADKPQALKIVSHKRSVHSAYFSPSGRFLATTSLDDNIGLLSGANFESIDMIHHNNHTGRWISSFRGIWGWNDSCIFVGNMKRAVDVISSVEKKTITTLQSPLMTAIPCRFDAHPLQVGMLAGATSGGQVYVWTPS